MQNSDEQNNQAYKPQVTVIPSIKGQNGINSPALRQSTRLNVAAYCRVSTEEECQQSSYNLQVEHYTDLINGNPEWSLYYIYADEGISGTSLRNRKQFAQMITDALEGKINYIITKSISRFARNTIDTLNCVRQLCSLNPPVGIYFEKENIDTLDVKGELILTILSALAQDESRSISDNIRWALQKKMQKGDPIINLNRMLGYDYGPNKEWVINETQANTIRYIYNCFLSGTSATKIAVKLTQMGAATGHGKTSWTANSVLRILKNEKFTGDLVLQKTVTESFLTHKSVANNGQMPSYYIRDHHPAIIERNIWDRVQEELKAHRQNALSKHNNNTKETADSTTRSYPFSNRLICKGCGQKLIRRSLRIKYGDASYFKCPVWKCRNADGRLSQKTCNAPAIQEIVLEQCFMEKLYFLRDDYLKNGSHSFLVTEYQKACYLERGQGIESDYITQRLKLLKSQIQILKQQLNYHLDEQLMDQINQDLTHKLIEYHNLEEQESLQLMKPSYDWFIHALMELPMENAAGKKLNVLGVNAKKQTQDKPEFVDLAPDILVFSSSIFQQIVTKGYIVDGDEVILETTFNVVLHINLARRQLSDYLGYRRAYENGSMVMITDKREVIGGRKT